MKSLGLFVTNHRIIFISHVYLLQLENQMLTYTSHTLLDFAYCHSHELPAKGGVGGGGGL